MKLTYPLFTIVFSMSGLLFAQSPVVNFLDAGLQIGGMAVTRQCENAENAGVAGAEVSWDFSELDEIDNVINLTALDPLDTPFADSFPTANIVFFTPDTSSLEDEFETWQYYEISADNSEVNFLGLAAPFMTMDGSSTIIDTLFVIYTDPLLTAQLPYEFGNTFSDTYAYQSQVELDTIIPGFPSVFTTVVEGTATYSVDAYGMLMTPVAEYDNALRVRTALSTSTRVLEFPQLPPSTTESFGYSWFAEGEGFTLLSIDSSEVAPDIPGGENRLQVATFYLTAVNDVSNTENVLAPASIGLRVFPNPVRHTLSIDFDLPVAGEVSTRLYSLTGQLVRQTAPQPYTAGEQRVNLNLASLPTATYLLVIETEAGIVRQRVVKQ